MTDTARDRRVKSVPSTGARLCLLIAALFVVAAVYYVLAPVQVAAANGRDFDCGTVINGPKSGFAKGVCGAANDANASKATALGVSALIIAVGGFLVFGLERREEFIATPRRDVRGDSDSQ